MGVLTALSSSSSASKRGGWITMPFILAVVAGLGLAFSGLTSNLIVYLIKEFHINRVSAVKVFNFVNGFVAMLPVVAAVLADSYLGSFSVIWISSFISFMGILVVTLTAAISKLRPPPCESGGNFCSSPTTIQLTVLYLGLGLASLGIAGTRFTTGPMGAHQFDTLKHQATFFNWYVFILYISGVISSTAIVYVQDNVSWAWGFGITLTGNALGLALFLAGTRFYRPLNPQGSPFASLARVLIAAIRKRKAGVLSKSPGDYFQDPQNKNPDLLMPSTFFSFLNRAAMKTEEDAGKSRRICTVSEVEDFKSLIKMVPLWLSALVVSIPLVIQLSFVVLQALTIDRHIGNNFKVPAGTISVFIFLSSCITILLVDRILIPTWDRFAPQKPITPLQRVGIGHLLDVLSMAVSALVEIKRLKIAKMHNLQDRENFIVPMSIFWLIPSLALAGMGEGFLFPGHIAFFYQEFPKHLKSTSTAIVSLSIGVAFYAGNALIDVVRRYTDWLPDDINKGRLDKLYWLVAILGGLNFCYFLVCAWFYRYKINADNAIDHVSGCN